MKKLMAAAALMVANAGPAQAQGLPAGKTMIYGLGTQPCSAWTGARNTEKSTGSRAGVMPMVSWADGYVTAYEDVNQPHGFKETNQDSIQADINHYCASNPTNTISVAALHVINGLTQTPQADTPVISIYGVSRLTCSSWTKARSHNDDKDQTFMLMFAWAQGYLTGVSQGAVHIDHTDDPEFRLDLDHLCEKNPTRSWYEATQLATEDLLVFK